MITIDISVTARRLTAAVLLLAAPLAGCDQFAPPKPAQAQEKKAEAEYERGPHKGRMLRAGDFAVEITIFEEGAEPEFHVYPFWQEKPLDPAQVTLEMKLRRLGDRVDTFAFKPDGEYLRGNGVVKEPHSFDVVVTATAKGISGSWEYESYEGRTTIAKAAAEANGVKVEAAGPATLERFVDLTGRVVLQPQGRAEVRAWYAGRITELTKTIGQKVQKGELLVRVEASDTLRSYQIAAPISGIVVERNVNVGDVAAQAIYVIIDPAAVQAAFFAFPRDLELLRPGQAVEVSGLGDQKASSSVTMLSPSSDPGTQATTVYAELRNANGAWRPGMALEGIINVASDRVPLAVRTRALQRFREFTVVYARVGDVYEVRMLKLGRQTAEWSEVLEGIEPGEVYVSDNAFLIRADIEKSGAAHDH